MEAGLAMSNAAALAKQLKNLDKALEHVERFRHAIDGGAYIGDWTFELARHFRNVTAFEPDPKTFVLLQENVGNVPGVRLIAGALGDEDCSVSIGDAERKSYVHYVIKDSTGTVPMYRLDGLGLDDVDFIKLDCEGADPLALLGAKKTIARCLPILLVEDKNLGPQRFSSPSVRDVLAPWGYRQVWHHKPDALWVPR